MLRSARAMQVTVATALLGIVAGVVLPASEPEPEPVPESRPPSMQKPTENDVARLELAEAKRARKRAARLRVV